MSGWFSPSTPPGEGFHSTYAVQGWDTKRFREAHGIAKDHYLDAYCIAGSILKELSVQIPGEKAVYRIYQYRRHDRAVIKSQPERT